MTSLTLYTYIQIVFASADVLSNRKMLEMILRKKGYVCDQCSDGNEAVNLVKVKGPDHFDVIFMDSVMPVLVSQEYVLPLHCVNMLTHTPHDMSMLVRPRGGYADPRSGLWQAASGRDG
ncbi:response regulator [archaeon]|nr:MAG: response regulator [archaeon]